MSDSYIITMHLMLWLRKVVFYAALLNMFLVNYFVAVLVNFAALCGNGQRLSSWYRIAHCFLARQWIRFNPFLKIDLDSFEPLENNSQPRIILFNHLSMMDPFVVAALVWEKFLMTKFDAKFVYNAKVIQDIHIVNWIITTGQNIPIEVKSRGDNSCELNCYDQQSKDEMYRKCTEWLNEGNSLILFPEGGCNRGDPYVMEHIYKGAYELHKRTGVPIQIVGMHGTNYIWPSSRQVEAHYRGTISFKNFGLFDFNSVEEYQHTVRDRIESWLQTFKC